VGVAEALHPRRAAAELAAERVQERAGRSNRDHLGEREEIPIVRHEEGAGVLGQCDQIVVAGVI
jgi:hypothetical protein